MKSRMRSRELALVLLIAGGGVAALWSYLEHGDARHALSSAPAAARRGDGAAPPALGAGVAAWEDAAAAERARVEPPQAPDAQTAAGTPPAPPTVVGRVVDGAGQPIAGARVLAAGGRSWLRVPLDCEPIGITGEL